MNNKPPRLPGACPLPVTLFQRLSRDPRPASEPTLTSLASLTHGPRAIIMNVHIDRDLDVKHLRLIDDSHVYLATQVARADSDTRPAHPYIAHTYRYCGLYIRLDSVRKRTPLACYRPIHQLSLPRFLLLDDRVLRNHHAPIHHVSRDFHLRHHGDSLSTKHPKCRFQSWDRSCWTASFCKSGD